MKKVLLLAFIAGSFQINAMNPSRRIWVTEWGRKHQLLFTVSQVTMAQFVSELRRVYGLDSPTLNHLQLQIKYKNNAYFNQDLLDSVGDDPQNPIQVISYNPYQMPQP